MSALIEKWKKSGRFSEGLEILELYAPGHPLFPTLKKGESAINKLYLHQAIDSLIIEPVRTRKKRFTAKNGAPKWLHHRLKELYHVKAKTRNSFFDCRSDAERGEVSDQLIEYRKEIHQLCRQIELHEQTGELVEIPERPDKIKVEDFDLSDNPYQLVKDLTNVRSNISKAKKSLDKAYNERNSILIKKYETKLQNLNLKKDAIEHKLNNSGKAENE